MTMMQKKEMPARSGNYEASTAINEQLHNSSTSWKKQGEVRYKTVERAGREILLIRSDQEHSLAVMRNGELLIALGKADDEQEIIEWALAAARNGGFYPLEKALQKRGADHEKV